MDTAEQEQEQERIVVGARRTRKSGIPLQVNRKSETPRASRLGRADPILDSSRRVTRASSGTPVAKDRRTDELTTPKKAEGTPSSGRKTATETLTTPVRSVRKSAAKAMAELTPRRSVRKVSSKAESTSSPQETPKLTPMKSKRTSSLDTASKSSALITTPRRSARASSPAAPSATPSKSSATPSKSRAIPTSEVKNRTPSASPAAERRRPPSASPAKASAQLTTPRRSSASPAMSPAARSSATARSSQTPVTPQQEESPAARRTRRFSGAVLGGSAEVATPTRRSRRRSGLEPETTSSSEAVSMAPDGGLVLGSGRKGGSTPRSARRHTVVRREDVDVALGLTPTALAPVLEDVQEEKVEEVDQTEGQQQKGGKGKRRSTLLAGVNLPTIQEQDQDIGESAKKRSTRRTRKTISLDAQSIKDIESSSSVNVASSSRASLLETGENSSGSTRSLRRSRVLGKNEGLLFSSPSDPVNQKNEDDVEDEEKGEKKKVKKYVVRNKKKSYRLY